MVAEWESVRVDASVVDRFEVPGGWLYRVQTPIWSQHNDTGHNSQGTAVTVTFVPTPEGGAR